MPAAKSPARCAASARRRWSAATSPVPTGTNYGDTWRHPLTPYRDQGADKPTLPIKGTASIAGYGHWLGIVYGQGADKGVRRAACVENALNLLDTGEDDTGPRPNVAVSGYDMDNAKDAPVVRIALPPTIRWKAWSGMRTALSRMKPR